MAAIIVQRASYRTSTKKQIVGWRNVARKIVEHPAYTVFVFWKKKIILSKYVYDGDIAKYYNERKQERLFYSSNVN